MMTTTEAAAALQVTRRRILELIRLGTLKAEKLGRDWFVDPASVEAFKATPRHAGRPRTIPLNGTDYHVFGEE
jgi:excisionase family DNA binding protein